MIYTIFQNGSVSLGSKELFRTKQRDCLRSKNVPGMYNFAVERLIADRFSFDISLDKDKLYFPEINFQIEMIRFLEHGGFDESDEMYFFEEFLLRMSGFDSSETEKSLAKLQDSSLKKKLYLVNDLQYPEMVESHKDDISRDRFEREVIEENITIGFTAGDIHLLQNFLQSFVQSFKDYSGNFSFVVCCFRLESAEVMKVFMDKGISSDSLVVLDEEWGHLQAKLGKLGKWFLDEENCSGVSFGRCVLHRALYEYSKDEIIWILDDDVIFSEYNVVQLSDSIQQMRSNNRHVGIGTILGDAPLPPPYIIRTQAVDFYYANFTIGNQRWFDLHQNSSKHDVHHDLATSRTDHLEIPIGLEKASQFDLQKWSIFSGKSITREIHREWMNQEKILTRGGNTLLIGKLSLARWPNVAPNCGGIQFRRGDTIWARLIESEAPQIICNINLSLEQKRLDSRESFDSVSSIRGDILGSMYSRVLRDCRVLEIDEAVVLDIIRNSKLRESRLISNLFRAHYLLKLLSYDAKKLHQLYILMNEIFTTPLPSSLYSDLKEYSYQQYRNISFFSSIEQGEF